MKTASPKIVSAFKDVAYELDVDLRSYSGRNMYGKTCLGVTLGAGQVFRFVAEVTVLVTEFGDGFLTEEIIDIMDRARTDSMGYDTILYFPSLSAEGIEDSEEVAA